MKLFCTFTLCLLGFAGCSNQDTNKTREEASKVTSEFKQATKDASKEIKRGAEEARKQGSAIAEGVREGWNSDQKAVNVNSASTSQLMSLPGIDAQSAHRIISNRPYRAKEDLAKRGIVGEDEYHRIEDKIVVN
jgi:DNA uptake protein ComE-like DNA-binding protein